MSEIDLVVPYVDCLDTKWQELFKKYNPSVTSEGVNALNRFRGQGEFFRFFFRCIQTNLPFIRKIHLIVQSESQVPYWIDRNKVHIVLHQEFIPRNYLPLFNSTAIEMFIPFIPDLSEKFLYANDDLFVIKPLKETDFFDGNNVRTCCRLCGDLGSMYGHHIKNSFELVYGKIDSNKMLQYNLVPGTCFGFSHLIRPLLKSKCRELFENNVGNIYNSISRFRQENNYNVYIYDHYMIYSGHQSPRLNIYGATINSNTESSTIKTILNNQKYNMINLCDTSDKVNIYDNSYLKLYFRTTYPYMSKYEKLA